MYVFSAKSYRREKSEVNVEKLKVLLATQSLDKKRQLFSLKKDSRRGLNLSSKGNLNNLSASPLILPIGFKISFFQ